MSAREIEEYSALRATIRQRGTMRVALFAAGMVAWAALAAGLVVAGAAPALLILPLCVLFALFEAVFALHIGVERIGRYLQVFFEDGTDGPGWEHRVIAFGGVVGARPAAAGTRQPAALDPLFVIPFVIASLLNLALAGVFDPAPAEWLPLSLFHAVFVGRTLVARGHARRQRALDLERFLLVKQNEQPAAVVTSPPAR